MLEKLPYAYGTINTRIPYAWRLSKRRDADVRRVERGANLVRVVLFLALAGCGGEPPAPQYVWNGFGYEWETLSHRLSLVQAMMTETGGAEVGMIGGDWSTGATFSDLPTVRNRVLAVRSDEVFVLHGASTLTLDRNTLASVTETVTIPEGWEAAGVSPVLRGIRLNTNIAQGMIIPMIMTRVWATRVRGCPTMSVLQT